VQELFAWARERLEHIVYAEVFCEHQFLLIYFISALEVNAAVEKLHQRMHVSVFANQVKLRVSRLSVEIEFGPVLGKQGSANVLLGVLVFSRARSQIAVTLRFLRQDNLRILARNGFGCAGCFCLPIFIHAEHLLLVFRLDVLPLLLEIIHIRRFVLLHVSVDKVRQQSLEKVTK
jgi:hypothetical protein